MELHGHLHCYGEWLMRIRLLHYLGLAIAAEWQLFRKQSWMM